MDMLSVSIWSGFNSDHGITYTHQWTFSPEGITVAQCSLSFVDFNLEHWITSASTGIAAYMTRPTPDGQDQTVTFGTAWWAPPHIFVFRLSGVTFFTRVPSQTDCTMLGTIFFL